MILNERDYVDRLLSTNTFSDKPINDIRLAARYFYADGYNEEVVRQKVRELLIRCDPTANVVLWGDTLDRQVRKAAKRGLIEIDYIPITQSEIDTVSSLPTKTMKKVLFSFLCSAKFYDMVNPNNNGWTNTPIKDICAMAGVTLTTHKQHEMRGDLSQRGLLELSRVVDNANTRVKFIDHDGDAVMKVDDMRNLGNQFLMHMGERYLQCAECGLVVPRRSNNQLYCSDCTKNMTHKKKQLTPTS